MIIRLRLVLRGVVQGVGFRPYVYRLAGELGLAGWVRNGPEGVVCEVEGPEAAVDRLRDRLPRELPPRASIDALEAARLPATGAATFEILASASGSPPAPTVPPDLAPCGDCLRELRDPEDRRHRYPFLNCTRCGPRYSILEDLPWDRARTSMRGFALCAACRREFEDPADRRFHAQPLACPECGPSLSLLDPEGRSSASHEAALHATLDLLRDGRIAAVKGVGGFHLLVDARNDAAVRRLRERKHREEKPFAVLVAGLEEARLLARLDGLEETLLTGPEAPIVLVRSRSGGPAPSVAPGNPLLGLLLPPSPLHVLISEGFGAPLVATSGNRGGEPLCTGNGEALERLAGIADAFLVHDRPIVRPLDDSIVRVVDGRPLPLRCGRGFAPLAIPNPTPPALAVGGHLKGAVAVSDGVRTVLGPHLGDLGHPAADDAFRRALEDLPRLYRVKPPCVVHDRHPEYRSTHHAESLGLPPLGVQHHEAHAMAAMADNGLEPPVFAVVWDGAGWGPDGTVWGGEFLRIDADGVTRLEHLRRFRLPGGDRAAREPRRAALGVLHELGIPAESAPAELDALERGVNSPWTSSAGRLFDAVAAILGLRERCSFEGQAAMALEFLVEAEEDGGYHDGTSTDWGPIVLGVLRDRDAGLPASRIAARFHRGLAELAVGAARRAGLENVVLSGGCFQNQVLAELVSRRLREEGFQPHAHRRVPPNDGGLALGQLVALARRTTPCASPSPAASSA